MYRSYASIQNAPPLYACRRAFAAKETEKRVSGYHTRSSILRSYFAVEENEVHLNEDERHSSGWRESKKDVVAFGVSFQLEVLAELQSWVDHAAYSEGCNNRKNGIFPFPDFWEVIQRFRNTASSALKIPILGDTLTLDY